jgi:hypothetical protein
MRHFFHFFGRTNESIELNFKIGMPANEFSIKKNELFSNLLHGNLLRLLLKYVVVKRRVKVYHISNFL